MGACEVALRDSGRASLGRVLCLLNLLVAVLAEAILVFLLISAPRWRRDQGLYGARAVDSWYRLLLATSLSAGALHLLGAKLCHDCGYWWTRPRFQSVLLRWVLAVLVSTGVTVAAVVVTFTTPSRLAAGLEERLTSAMDGYRDDPQQKAFVDRLQQRSRCCGVWGHADWLTTSWVRREDVPGSGVAFYDMNSAYDNMLQADGSLLVKWAPWSCCDPEYGDVCNSAYDMLPHPASSCDSLRQRSGLLQADLPSDEQLEAVRPHAAPPPQPTSTTSSTAAPDTDTTDTGEEQPGAQEQNPEKQDGKKPSTKSKKPVPEQDKNPVSKPKVKPASKTKDKPAPKLTNKPVPKPANKPVPKPAKKPYTKSKKWPPKKGKKNPYTKSKKWPPKKGKKKPARVTTARWGLTPPPLTPQPTLRPFTFPLFGFGPPVTTRRSRVTPTPLKPQPTMPPFTFPMNGFGPPPMKKRGKSKYKYKKKRWRRGLHGKGKEDSKTTLGLKERIGSAQNTSESMGAVMSSVRDVNDSTEKYTKSVKVIAYDVSGNYSRGEWLNAERDVNLKYRGAVIRETLYLESENTTDQFLTETTVPSGVQSTPQQRSEIRHQRIHGHRFNTELDDRAAYDHLGGRQDMADGVSKLAAEVDDISEEIHRHTTEAYGQDMLSTQYRLFLEINDLFNGPDLSRPSMADDGSSGFAAGVGDAEVISLMPSAETYQEDRLASYEQGRTNKYSVTDDKDDKIVTPLTPGGLIQEIIGLDSVTRMPLYVSPISRGVSPVYIPVTSASGNITSNTSDVTSDSNNSRLVTGDVTHISSDHTLSSSDIKLPASDVHSSGITGTSLSHPNDVIKAMRQRRRAYWIVDRKPDPNAPLPPDPRYELPDGPKKDFLFTGIDAFITEYRSPQHDCDALLESGKKLLAKIEAVPGLPEAMQARLRDSKNYWTLYYVANGITTTLKPNPYAKYIMRLVDKWRNQDFVNTSPGEVASRVIRYFKPCVEAIRPPLRPDRDCPPPWRPEHGWYLANFDDDEYTTEVLRPAYNEMEVYLHMQQTQTKDVVFTDFKKQRLKREVDRVEKQLETMRSYGLDNPLEMRYDVLYCRLKQEPTDAFFETGCLSAAAAQVAAVFGPLPYLLLATALLQLLVAVLARYLQSANESAARHGDLRLTAYGCLLGQATDLPPGATDADSSAIYTEEDELAEGGIRLAKPADRTQSPSESAPARGRRKPKRASKKKMKKKKNKRRKKGRKKGKQKRRKRKRRR